MEEYVFFGDGVPACWPAASLSRPSRCEAPRKTHALPFYHRRVLPYNGCMSTRRAKQIIYGMFYLLLWAAFIALIYFAVQFVAPSAPATPACTPSTCAPTDTAPIATSTVWTFVTSPGHYTFLTQVANTSTDYAATYLGYAIDLYDASGTVLQSIPGSSFVYPGQSKYLVVPNVQVSSTFVSAGLSVAQVSWQASSSLGAIPQFTKENVVSGSTSSTVSVSGQLTNANLSATRYVFVDVIFNGADGSPIGASQTELDGVAPGQTVNFSVMYPQTGSIDPTESTVVVYGLK